MNSSGHRVATIRVTSIYQQLAVGAVLASDLPLSAQRLQ
jgi:hypothetical protein